MTSPNIEVLEQPFGSMFGDISGQMAAQVSGDVTMSGNNSFTDLVFSLSDEEFKALRDAVAVRKNKRRYGVTSFNELAIKYKRKPTCPR